MKTNSDREEHRCERCEQVFSWAQGSPQELTTVEQMICIKENLPFTRMKKITCPHCGVQSLAVKPAGN